MTACLTMRENNWAQLREAITGKHDTHIFDGAQNTAIAFWQSRSGMRNIRLTDINKLAREVRQAYPLKTSR